MIDAIVPARIVRDRPGCQVVRYRPPVACEAAERTGPGPLRYDRREPALYEIPWYGSRIEEKYGPLLGARAYRGRTHPLCGLFVDLFV